MKVLAVIQARIGSTRLPGKILKDIMGKPMLWHMINRMQYAQRMSDIVIAIPDSAPNDTLELYTKELGVKCFRGSEEDVLTRYHAAAVQYKGDVIVRLTSDCPLIDPRIIDSTIEAHFNSDADYTSMGAKSGLPLGLSTEVFNFEALDKAFKEAEKDYEREHVTPYIYQHTELFKIHVLQAESNLMRPELRLTVDTEEDLTLVREIYRYLYHDGKMFYTEDIISLLDSHPELIAINAHIKQKALGE